MWLKSLRLVFVGVLIGMALACLAFLWRSDDHYIKQQSKMNYNDSKVYTSVCVGGGRMNLLYTLYKVDAIPRYGFETVGYEVG